MCGWSEWKIDFVFWSVGLICSGITLWILSNLSKEIDNEKITTYQNKKVLVLGLAKVVSAQRNSYMS